MEQQTNCEDCQNCMKNLGIINDEKLSQIPPRYIKNKRSIRLKANMITSDGIKKYFIDNKEVNHEHFLKYVSII